MIALLSDGEDDPDFVRALARGLEVLEAFDAANPALTLSQVATRIGLSRGSTRRFLLTLTHLGYLSMKDGRFSLRARVLRLGYGYLSALPIWVAARPIVEEVAAETGESCSVAILDGSDIVYVARAAAPRLINDYVAIGTRLAVHATSMGKILVASLPDAERAAWMETSRLDRLTPHTLTDHAAFAAEIERTLLRGWAINDEEIEVGLRSIAVGIAGERHVEAAINVSVPAARVGVEQLESYLPPLRRAAASISDVLRTRSPISSARRT